MLLAGARLGAQGDFAPSEEYQPDVGPDPDLDAMRLRLAGLLDSVDTYTYNFDPYDPELVGGQLSDDLTSIATDLANGLRHFRAGNVDEALWWWQFSYVARWGNNASAALRALQSVVAHDRLDTDFEGERTRSRRPRRAGQSPERRSLENRPVDRLGRRPIPRGHDQVAREQPWASSCRSTAVPRSPTPPPSSASPAASSRQEGRQRRRRRGLRHG